MKILLAIHQFTPHSTGSAEWWAFCSARASQEHGHAVPLVCIERVDYGLSGGEMIQGDTFAGLPVRHLFINLPLAPDPDTWEYDNLRVGAPGDAADLALAVAPLVGRADPLPGL